MLVVGILTLWKNKWPCLQTENKKSTYWKVLIFSIFMNNLETSILISLFHDWCLSASSLSWIFFFLQYFRIFIPIIYICNTFSGIYTLFSNCSCCLCHYIRTGLQSGVPSFLIAKKPEFLNLISSSQQAFSFQVWLNTCAPPTEQKILCNGKSALSKMEHWTLGLFSVCPMHHNLPLWQQMSSKSSKFVYYKRTENNISCVRNGWL